MSRNTPKVKLSHNLSFTNEGYNQHKTNWHRPQAVPWGREGRWDQPSRQWVGGDISHRFFAGCYAVSVDTPKANGTSDKKRNNRQQME